ncbi:hypothetical protein ABZ499_33680 [Streptomyces sp. NPDC019990]|uniref:hypothetical protein n=1 Tax=Streptomyces sp. NPDC019990 TaxID=3154693 RepID=UPI0033D3265C
MSREGFTALDFKSAEKIGRWCARLGFLSGAVVFLLWLFSSNPTLRKWGILSALSCAMLCVVAIVLFQRRVGGRQPFSMVAASEFTGAGGEVVRASSNTETAPVPRHVPSRRRQLWGSFAGTVGVWTIFVGLIAMAWGAPDRPPVLERIHSAGAAFAEVQVERVWDVRFHNPSRGKSHYTASTLVLLPGVEGADPETAKVTTESFDRLRPGDRVSVLYAPTQPQLGAVAGSEKDLEHELDGGTLPDRVVLLLLIGWGVGLCVVAALAYTENGFRSFARLQEGDHHIRARIVQVAQFQQASSEVERSASKSQSLLLDTAAGNVHFLVNITEQDLSESVKGEQIWLCWDGRRGANVRRFSPRVTPAVLVSDHNWVMHGMLPVIEGQRLAAANFSSTPNVIDSTSESRPLHVWNPYSKWSLYMSPLTLGLLALLIAGAALMTFSVPSGWRWAVGVAGPLGSALLAGSFLSDRKPSQ